MDMQVAAVTDPLASMKASGICPIITNPDWLTAIQADPTTFARTMLEFDVRTVEIADRADGVLNTFSEIAVELHNKGIMPGLGSVVGMNQVHKMLRSHASFAVSPGFSSDVCESLHTRILYIPGVETTSEFILALKSGCNTLKFFPARDREEELKERMASLKYSYSSLVVNVSGLRDFSEEALAKWFKAGASIITIGSELFDKGEPGNWDLLAQNLEMFTKRIEKVRG